MRPIRLNEEHLTKIKEHIDTMLNMYNADESLTLKLDSSVVAVEVPKPIVYLTASAYVKMTYLIHTSNKELAWHGTVTKIENNYLIEDIFVYPQTVTAATVDSDDAKYPVWCMQLSDEVINKLRFQGHSHVNMGASPSGRDTTNWKDFLNILKEDEFYIFCIGNKKGDYYWTIYDNAINVMFENKDITWAVIDEQGNNIVDWTKEQIETHIVESKPTYLDRTVYNTQNNLFNSQYAGAKTVSQPASKTTDTVERRAIVDSDFIPYGLRELDGVEYDPDLDQYFSYTYIAGFNWSTLWNCFVMHGAECRKKYGFAKISNAAEPKKKRGRPPKGEKK